MSGIVILVVEDEPLVRLNVVDDLVAAGYTVLDAGNADEAMQIWEQRDDIAVVFTDINMPGSMDGLELVEAISKRQPPVFPIVTSGKNALPDAALPNGGRFIPKPYTCEQILSVVEQLAA